MLLDDATDDDLIAELKRRGRLRTAARTTVFYNELAFDEQYMETVNRDLTTSLVQLVENSLCFSYRERTIKRDSFGRSVQMARKASMTVLLPEGAEASND